MRLEQEIVIDNNVTIKNLYKNIFEDFSKIPDVHKPFEII